MTGQGPSSITCSTTLNLFLTAPDAMYRRTSRVYPIFKSWTRASRPPAAASAARLDRLALCCGAAQSVCNHALLVLFRAVSKLGDWPLSVIVGFSLLAVHGPRPFCSLGNRFGARRHRPETAQEPLRTIAPCERPQGRRNALRFRTMGRFRRGNPACGDGDHRDSFAVTAAAPFFLLIGLLIALSRVVLGMHYPSDVIAGAALGGIFASILLATL